VCIAKGRGSTDATASPTITSPAMTRMGVVLGTAAYMAPEQARGKTVDKRADIWAFGCVLYEMLAGKKPFEGETVTDVVAAILKNDPDWRPLPPNTPAGVRSLLGRCLTKAPDNRLHDIADARLEIDDALAIDQDRRAIAGPDLKRATPSWQTAVWLVIGAIVTSVAVTFGSGDFGVRPRRRLATALDVSSPPLSGFL
jgi:eukaryotic-like serine/threonine-protein kinase